MRVSANGSKKLFRLQFYELARKEIGALIVADEHPNIVRCFAMEEDAEFVYLALERCKQSLNDLVGGGDAATLLLDGGRASDLCLQVRYLSIFLAFTKSCQTSMLLSGPQL